MTGDRRPSEKENASQIGTAAPSVASPAAASPVAADPDLADPDLADPDLHELYRDLFENGPAAYIAASPDGRIRRVNRRAVELLGYSRAELMGRPVLDLYPEGPEGRGKAEKLATSECRDEELLMRRAEGEPIWVSLTVRLVRDGEGRVVERRGILLDVTERREARTALKESQERFQRIFDHSNDGIFLLDPRSERIEGANARAAEMLGYAREQLIGLPLESIHPGEMPGLRAFFQKVLDEGEGWTEELTCLTKEGRTIPSEISAAPLPSEGGSQVVAAVRDVSERRRSERALRTAVEELEAFSYSVSHDLRAPLRAIDGFSRMLLEDHGDHLDHEARRLIGVVRDSTRRMNALIDGLLALSRLGQREMTVVPVDLAELARAALDELRAGDGEEEVEARIHQPLPAHGDPTMLRQVMVNLLSNALKYRRPDTPPVIEVGSAPGEDGPVFHVRDNGMGFDMAYVHKIFGVFERLHSDDGVEGTGVGLAIVKRIVNRHGGRVWAEGTPGEGATVYFTLPVGEARSGW
ncbi:MAG: PAS domain-containing sensor histidine kinase [Gemmatimonadales bacterium]|nr:MAG: PAS domain-containing sensor histidine kinase [Gemmatimonadales bacterium]